MAAVPIIQKGKFVIYGLGDNVLVSGIAGIVESGKADHKGTLSNVEDENGSDAALIFTNEHVEATFVLVPTEDADFVPPLSTIVTIGFAMAALNSSWFYLGDGSLDMSHKMSKVSTKCRRYIGNANLVPS
jgi:hypothetical protein